jgi:hypothetical protein
MSKTSFIKHPLPRDFIFEFQGDKDLVSRYCNEIITNKEAKFKSINNTSSIEYSYPILKNDCLINWMTDCVNEVASIYFENVKLKINDIWLTKSNFLSTGEFHHHSLSIFSGLLYLNDHETHTIFSVADEFQKRYLELYTGIFKKPINHKITVEPALAKLIIWPSYLLHKIDTTKSKSARYTVAFNSFFDGTVCDGHTKQLHLDTKGPAFI